MFCYCAEARRLARSLTARYDRHLKAAGLTAAQFEVLSVVKARETSTGRDLANLLHVDPTTLSRNLKPLCVGGVVKATRSQGDARQMLYSLTAKGTALLEAAQPLWQGAHRETEQMLGTSVQSTPSIMRYLAEVLHG